MIKKGIFAVILCLSIVLSSCSESGGEVVSANTSVETANTSGMDFTFTDRDNTASYDKNNVTSIALSPDAKTEITKEGTYIFSGEMANKTILVNAPEAKVQIVLDNAKITTSSSPAIYVKDANKVFITLKDGTQNIIEDGSGYTYTDGDTDIDGAIFSKADLTFNGGGALSINAQNKHAIVSKDDLVITGGSYDIKAQNVGLNGKDCVKIGGGSIKISSGTDAIRSDNAEDSAKGYIYLEGGALELTSGKDAVQAETIIKCENVTLTAVCSSGHKSPNYSSESAKGLKAGSDIIISGGSYNIDSLDDCIHSNGTISISGGSFNLASGDDGLHADKDLSVSGGELIISDSYEGLEGSKIVVSGGNLSLKASDDGLNAAGGNDGANTGLRQDNFSRSSGEIVITGGYTLIDASGDGIDSNGSVSLSGGVVLVSGPTNNGNGSFDYDSSASVTGGVLIALGSSGMAQGFSSAENQGAILVTFQAQNQSFALCDENAKAIVSFTCEKSYSSAVITSPDIQSGGTYSIVIGGRVDGADKNGFTQNAKISGGTTLTTVEMTSNLYSVGGGGMHGGGGMPGGPGGRPGGGRPGGMRPW